MIKVIRNFLLPFILINGFSFPITTFAQLDKLKIVAFPKWKIIDAASTASPHLFKSKKIALVTHQVNSGNTQKNLLEGAQHEGANKNWQNNFNVSDQVKMSLNTLTRSTPFVMLNTMGSSNSSNILLDQHSTVFSKQINQLRLVDNNWIVRGIFGIDSQPLFNNLIAGLGVGAAVINQNLNNNIMFSNFSFLENSQISIRPSVLASATWLACPTCIAGHGGSISFQVTVDQYSTFEFENFSLQPNVNQKWQLSEMLVFNVRI